MLSDEKFGFIILESDERPGPQSIVGYTVLMNCVVVDILEPSTVDRICIVENGVCRENRLFIVEYAVGSIVEYVERLAKLL